MPQRWNRVLERVLRPLSRVHPGEAVVATLMLACVLLVLTSYYVMKTAREGLILSGGTLGLRGDELKTYATGTMAILLVAIVPAYGQLANRVRRIRLVNISYTLVVASLLGFFLLGTAGVPIGLAFFIWLGLVSVFLVAQFWSYANDIYTEEQGKRLFAIIAIGGSLGAMIGPRIAKLANTFALLVIAAAILVACVVLFNIVERIHRHTAESSHADEPITGGGGFSLVLHDRYLLLIAVMMLVLNLINTTGEYVLSNAVRTRALELSADPAQQRELIKGMYADFFSWVNLTAFLVQAFAVSRIIDKLGVRRALFVMPVVVFGAYSAIAAIGGFALIRAAKVIDNATDYSLQNTVRQSLFLRTTRAAKFKAKAAIDTFFVRTGDLASALLVGFGLHQLGLDARQLAIVNVALVGVWLVICAGIARRHRALDTPETVPDAAPVPSPRTRSGKLAAASAGVALLVAMPRDATGDPAPDPEPVVSASDVAGAPRPGEESGRTDPHDDGPSVARRIGRATLFVPRAALEVAFAPVRAGIYASEKYYIYDRLYDLFFDDTHTMGIYPTVDVESDFGGTLGVKAVHRDLFGHHERATLAVAFGGRFHERIGIALRSGSPRARIAFELHGELDRRPEEPYYGIGMPAPAMPGTEARFRQQLARAALVIDTRLLERAHVRASGSVTGLDFDRGESTAAIDELYLPSQLVGYEGFRQGYAELELRYDSRRAQPPWDPPVLHSRGRFASLFLGHASRLEEPHAYWRTGFDLQQYLRLGEGPRTLILRLYGETVEGTYHEVPFTELPLLGGKRLLRGYPTDRFRDRVALLGAVEYQWDLGRRMSASLFVDTGHVAPSLAALDRLDTSELAVGYGLGLQLHTSRVFLARASIASSIDGGLQLAFSFEPVFEQTLRTERR